VLRRGPDGRPGLAADGLHLSGRRFWIRLLRAGRHDAPAADAAFFLGGGRVEVAGHPSLDVPRARTVALPPVATRLTSDGWIVLVGTPSRPRPEGTSSGGSALRHG
jgi:hypothetical protein